MKDRRTHYGATDEFSLEQKICGSISTPLLQERTGPILLVLVGLMGGREAGRSNMSRFKHLSNSLATGKVFTFCMV